MNLQKQLFFRIVLIALFCLASSAYYVLYQTNAQAKYEANITANSIEKQLRSQLLKLFARNDFSSPFPNTERWPELNGLSGSCIEFVSHIQSRQQTLCNTNDSEQQTWPDWFGSLYSNLFNPDYQTKRGITFNALIYGAIIVKLNTNRETARAWSNFRAVIGVFSVTILALVLLVYVTINRMLKPATAIIIGLEKMRDGHLDTRLPSFDVVEWKRTSEAINQLASSQERVIADNKQLALKLMNVQEEEQRYISRELHDEFGQCLAGINALASSIGQSAQKQSPDLVPEIKNISHISHHMMELLRDLLTRLRPAEVDDFGLESSLKKLIASWNARAKDQTHYQLTMTGNMALLSEPLPSNLYRIVQECLTNIAKHANASQATIELEITNKNIVLTVSDDGVADTDSFDDVIGVGLLGIRERVAALGGKLTLQTRQPSGLNVTINLPLLINQ